MIEIHTAKEIQTIANTYRKEGKTIGFVPTMGFLHEGHMALVKKARKDNDIVVMSIFVNPLQFGPGEDYEAYPRDIERDRKLAEEGGVDVLFTPAPEEMYKAESTVIASVKKRTDVLCGRSRQGHFDGVATVLTKLFNLASPTRVYFGMKDAQQVAVVDGLIDDFFMDIELVPVDTVREEDGLAKSSRNVYLTQSERKEAAALYEALRHGARLVSEGERNPDAVKKEIRGILEKTSGVIDYAEIYSYPELKSLKTLSGKFIIAVAVKFSKARLIDNIIIEIPDDQKEDE
ncbi:MULTISPECIES: pantoate--beta-alanine ligase [Bacillus]|uniref:Pantothenate synthetase n=1 Tax=Bacillus glycinifermentans TaxID=1664069 RepID=A0AAJ3YZN7_9BACI|nr:MULTISPECIES: pantoate--beta-alanine ligase [Bacillus]KKB74785.1 pantoate--beta-alanine ligase [Bacillus sp. TH008]MDU0070853.1 pantoate--beta-alanine ligase [Bacillus sp. IG6]MED8018719.1 pantoate--beta-alanine ligase [Bacillus glycinifermentans]QAT65793.1 pantoate--beta-alanine ligase [Bacillus glycinifermentans]WKB75494.1 pantoate--beta-alanine ligase [Bacillus glycinifermentans]